MNVVDLKTVGGRVFRQDGRATAHPIFAVRQKVRDYGYDREYSDGVAWVRCDEGEEVSSEEAAQCPEMHVEVGYRDRWEFVAPFFTERAAEQFIENNAHRYSDLEVYVYSGYRNPEWQAVRKHLIDHWMGQCVSIR